MGTVCTETRDVGLRPWPWSVVGHWMHALEGKSLSKLSLTGKSGGGKFYAMTLGDMCYNRIKFSISSQTRREEMMC